MKVSTRGRYALRLMLDLALNNTGEPVRLKDVAKRQEISEKYLEQIISILNKAGFVKSVRGPAGGYSLKRKPEEYRGHDPASDRGQPCAGGLCRRRRRLRQGRSVRYGDALEKTERCHQQCGGQYYAGRSGGMADAEVE